MIRVLAVVTAALLLGGCADAEDVTERVSEGSLKIAVRNGVAAELAERGFRPRDLACRTVPGATLARVEVRCAGATAEGLPITVDGVAEKADTPDPRQSYVVRVGGREVLRQDCLAAGCK